MDQSQNEKAGQGVLQAALRLGTKELAQILPAFPDSVKPIEEPGALGNLTPQEVVQQKHGREREPELEM
jgi:hypothetical protein